MNPKNIKHVRTLGPLAAALIFVATLNLRPAITAVGPVIDEIGASFNIGPALLGLLGSMPLIMFAIVSPAGSFVASKIGIDRVIFYVLLLIACGILVRSYLGLPGLWIGVIVATAAIALGNVLVPSLIKRDYPQKVALATGIYTTTMGLGASFASGVSFPIAVQTGWRFSLALWAIPALLVAVLWVTRLNASAPQKVIKLKQKGSVWSSSTAWWLTIYMGVQSSTFYFMITWLPAIAVESGKNPVEAGIMLFWYQIFGMIGGMLLPFVMGQKTDQTVAAVLAGGPIFIGFVGLLLFPTLGFLWAIFLGVGSGCSLVVSLTLITMRARSEAETSQLSGMVQSFGYLLAALVPVSGGVLFQIFETWKAPLIMMVVISFVQVTLTRIVGTGKTRSRN